MGHTQWGILNNGAYLMGHTQQWGILNNGAYSMGHTQQWGTLDEAYSMGHTRAPYSSVCMVAYFHARTIQSYKNLG